VIEERDARGRRIRANEPDDAIVEVWKIERHGHDPIIVRDYAVACDCASTLLLDAMDSLELDDEHPHITLTVKVIHMAKSDIPYEEARP
jgi:hypothetical protein